MTHLSPARLQVMWNRLLAVVEEQGQTLIRAAFSPIVRECGDISAGIFDVRGRMLAQAVTGTPGHINTMAEAVKTLRARFPVQHMAPGDIYMTNDPFPPIDAGLQGRARHRLHLLHVASGRPRRARDGARGFGRLR